MRRLCLAVPFLLAAFLFAIASLPAQSARPAGVTGSTKSLETMTTPQLKELNSELAVREDSLERRLDSLKQERVRAGLPPLDPGIFGSILTPPPVSASPTVAQVHARLEAKQRTVRATSLYVTLLAIAPFINTVKPFDVDSGGYVSTWGTRDKLEHAGISSLASAAGGAIGAHWLAQVLGPCAAGAWWEYSQSRFGGLFDTKDLGAGCGAALATTAVTAALRRISR